MELNKKIKLELNNSYTREEVHNIFSPNTKFVRGTGSWGLQGIVNIKKTKNYIFFVNLKKKSNYDFEEGILDEEYFNWRSQDRQKLSTPMITNFINHDSDKNNVYLFVRKENKEKNLKYTYLGLLGYESHNNEKENPVWIKWRLLNIDSLDKEKLNEFIIESQNRQNKENINSLKEEKCNYDIKDLKNIKITVGYNDNINSILDNSKNRKGVKSNEFKKLKIKNINYEKKHKDNSKLGEDGERFILEYEKQKLEEIGRKDLANLIYLTRDLEGNSAPYDIHSYDKDGKDKYIEVKTTTGDLDDEFYISQSEVEFSIENSENYYLYRVYNFYSNNLGIEIAKGKIDLNKLQPVSYKTKILK